MKKILSSVVLFILALILYTPLSIANDNTASNQILNNVLTKNFSLLTEIWKYLTEPSCSSHEFEKRFRKRINRGSGELSQMMKLYKQIPEIYNKLNNIRRRFNNIRTCNPQGAREVA